MRTLVTMVLASSCAYGAVPGSSASPYPGREDWIDTLNDGVITFRNRDDGLTGAVRGAGVTEEGTRICVDYRLMTDMPHHRRCDDATIAAGTNLEPSVGYEGELLAGVRFVGDLDGQSLQTNFHAAVGSKPTIAQYDTSVAPTPMVIAGVWPQPGHSGLDATAALDFWGLRWDMRLRFEDPTGHLRLTAGWRMHWGSAPSPTVRRVEDEADGYVLSAAARLGHVGYCFELGQHKVLASAGLVF